MSRSVQIIAEAGVNHNGDRKLAMALVEAAAASGADFVKFQSFDPSALVTPDAAKAPYQRAGADGAESQEPMLNRLVLSKPDQGAVAGHCRECGIGFLSTPFDLQSLAFLVDRLKVPALKLSSGSLTNGPLLLAAARTGLPLILSTGMATMDEISEALNLLAFGWLSRGEPDGRTVIRAAGDSPEGRDSLRRNVTLLHCTTAYPAPFDQVNLRAMDAMRKAFGLRIGYSDHTEGIAVSIAAAALGAVVIEKHLTLDRSLPGPDHAASVEPDEMKALVRGVRLVSQALGSAAKSPVPAEAANSRVVRQSLVTLAPVAAGAVFTRENLGVKRPGTGVSPMEYWDRLGTPAPRDYTANELIDP